MYVGTEIARVHGCCKRPRGLCVLRPTYVFGAHEVGGAVLVEIVVVLGRPADATHWHTIFVYWAPAVDPRSHAGVIMNHVSGVRDTDADFFVLRCRLARKEVLYIGCWRNLKAMHEVVSVRTTRCDVISCCPDVCNVCRYSVCPGARMRKYAAR